MCTIFAKKSFEDRKNVQASSTGEAQGRATVQQGVVAGSTPPPVYSAQFSWKAQRHSKLAG